MVAAIAKEVICGREAIIYRPALSLTLGFGGHSGPLGLLPNSPQMGFLGYILDIGLYNGLHPKAKPENFRSQLGHGPSVETKLTAPLG